jgi:alkanesulfonate monooxygenase SsuD/methylene tetrahydromethanopterin reductase-like flavin-dependent oxidoreductase (luciferase family)
MEIGFGVFSPQAGISYRAMLERATQLERLGYHSIWLVDHFWNRGVPEADVLECTATMSALGAGRRLDGRGVSCLRL